MSNITRTKAKPSELTLVLGGTGKTGRRVAQRLLAKGVPTRIAARSTSPSFDWKDETGWDTALEGIKAVYINYAPDLAIPGARAAIHRLLEKAEQHGVERAVLLSGRGEEEAQACERIVQASCLASTIVRASWFNQNFSEGAFLEMVLSGRIALPAAEVGEPFIDADDIADVAVAALTEPGHEGEVYEVTGPRLLTFADIAEELSFATGRPIHFTPIPHEAFVDGLKGSGAPHELVWLLDYLFSSVLDGRNAHTCDGVERALGRAPRDFSAYARDVAATGLWRQAA